MIASIVWIVCILAALAGAAFRSFDVSSLWVYALAAAVPAVISLALSPVLRREWAQIMVILAWLSLAILACLAVAFVPMAILFLCAPAAAMLFEREKVIEAMVLSALFAGILFYAGQSGILPADLQANELQSDWSKKVGIASTISFLIAAMYAGAAKQDKIIQTTGPAPESGHPDWRAGMPGEIFQVSRSNRIHGLSSSALGLLNADQDGEYRNLSDLLAGNDQRAEILSLIESARRRGTPQSGMFENQGGQNTAKHIEITASPGPQESVFIHLLDRSNTVRELARAVDDNSRVRSEADDKTLFFAGVSHELRTPLNAIIGFSDMMRSRLFGPLPGKYAEYADLIHDSGQHMLDLIGDVLDLSKVEVGKYDLSYTAFDAADVIRSTIKMIRPSADAAEVQLETEIEPANDELLIEADRKAVRQILLNLLSNAIKFTPKGGQVVVQAKSNGDALNITVRDNGVGMSADELKKVGQPFVQSKSGRESDARGSGLGLSLVKSLTELHGGRFSLASQIDKGTSAEIYLPLSQPDN